MELFTAAPHDDILALLIQTAVLLGAARLGGELALRIGQPAVIGELLAGIVLGPSLLSGLLPSVAHWIIPQNEVQGYLLEQMALLGAMFMLLITGLEIDIGLIRRHANAAIGTATGGLLVPFALGAALAMMLPDSLLVDPQERLVFVLFIATALALSAIPVIAKVLIDLDMLRRDVGQIVMAAAMIDDITAWTMLSILVGLASGTALSLWGVVQSILSVIIFVILTFTAGGWIVRQSLSLAQNTWKSADAVLTTVIVLTFAWGAISQAFHMEAVIGAFMIGILFGQLPTFPRNVIHTLEQLALAIFAPIFFAIAGLKVNLFMLGDPALLILTGMFLIIACIGKIVGAYAGARISGIRDHWAALSFGVALNARGAVGIIIATIGLSLGLLTQDMFSIIVLIAMITSLMVPSLLRWTLRRTEITPQERARLDREEQLRGNPVATARRILVPVRLRDIKSTATVQNIEAQILERLAGTDQLSVTLLSIAPPSEYAQAQTFLSQLSNLFHRQQVIRKVVSGNTPQNAILEEANKSYDLLVMGAPEPGSGSDVLFTPMIDYVVRFAPCPTIVVQGQRIAADWKPHRILVPTNGSLASRRAAQLAFALGADYETDVLLLTVVVPDTLTYHPEAATAEQRQLHITEQMVSSLQRLGTSLGARVGKEVQVAPDPTAAILELSRRIESDLIILGTNVRSGSDRLYLGVRVERLLRHAACPVMIINTPYAGSDPAHAPTEDTNGNGAHYDPSI